jgi:hypothetical protein
MQMYSLPLKEIVFPFEQAIQIYNDNLAIQAIPNSTA